MGRTVRTFRDGVRIEESRWKDFRRTLRPSQREHDGDPTDSRGHPALCDSGDVWRTRGHSEEGEGLGTTD